MLPLIVLTSALASRPLALRLILVGGLAPPLWWPFLQAQADVTTTVPAGQLPTATLLGVAAGLLVALAHGDLRVTRPTDAVTRAVLVLAVLASALVATADRAWAHDPGQGAQVREGRLTVERTAGRAQLTMVLPGPCAGLVPVRTAARRAGQTQTGPLYVADLAGGDCAVTGSVDGLGPGRWFIYAELHDPGGRRLEAWLSAADSATATEIRPLYAPPETGPRTSFDVVGAGLLLAVLGLLVASMRLARRVRTVGATRPE